MGSYHISGGNKLRGQIEVSGAKNAALPILAATVMTGGESLLSACPQISDVQSMTNILEALGCSVNSDGEILAVNAEGMTECRIPDKLMKEMRSSVFLAGALLTRCGEAVISNPGGCDIGKRPIDIHIEGLRKLGVEVSYTESHTELKARKLRGTDIVLPYPSVGATENIMMAALSAEGVTRIINSAAEPEIVDLQNYINRCGGCVRGSGTGTITIYGGKKLYGCRHSIMSDRIEAGTYLIMALATEGEILLDGITAELLMPLVEILQSAGFALKSGGDAEHGGNGYIYAKASGTERISCKVCTSPYPGFPTDLQPQLTALLTKIGAGSVVEENIFEKRMEYVKQLKKMGADIEMSQKKVIINNNNILCGDDVEAQDLRGGAALVIAGLMAQDRTTVRNTKYIKRGYSGLKEKVTGLGGEITEDEW